MIKNKNMGVYMIKNIETGRCYIGSSSKLNLRKRKHFSELRANKHNNIGLQSDFNITNPNSFIFEVIEFCNKEGLKDAEQKYLDKYMSYLPIFGYNIKTIATRNESVSMCDDEKLRRSIASKNRKQVRNVTTGEIFLSQREAARSINVDKNEIKRVCSGFKGRRTCKGFIFEYYNN